MFELVTERSGETLRLTLHAGEGHTGSLPVWMPTLLNDPTEVVETARKLLRQCLMAGEPKFCDLTRVVEMINSGMRHYEQSR